MHAALPPGLENLTKYTMQSRNMWVTTEPKVSVLHYDWQDSVLLQISGTKRFTLFPPDAIGGLYPYPIDHPLHRRSRVDLSFPPESTEERSEQKK